MILRLDIYKLTTRGPPLTWFSLPRIPPMQFLAYEHAIFKNYANDFMKITRKMRRARIISGLGSRWEE